MMIKEQKQENIEERKEEVITTYTGGISGFVYALCAGITGEQTLIRGGTKSSPMNYARNILNLSSPKPGTIKDKSISAGSLLAGFISATPSLGRITSNKKDGSKTYKTLPPPPFLSYESQNDMKINSKGIGLIKSFARIIHNNMELEYSLIFHNDKYILVSIYQLIKFKHKNLEDVEINLIIAELNRLKKSSEKKLNSSTIEIDENTIYSKIKVIFDFGEMKKEKFSIIADRYNEHFTSYVNSQNIKHVNKFNKDKIFKSFTELNNQLEELINQKTEDNSLCYKQFIEKIKECNNPHAKIIYLNILSNIFTEISEQTKKDFIEEINSIQTKGCNSPFFEELEQMQNSVPVTVTNSRNSQSEKIKFSFTKNLSWLYKQSGIKRERTITNKERTIANQDVGSNKTPRILVSKPNHNDETTCTHQFNFTLSNIEKNPDHEDISSNITTYTTKAKIAFKEILARVYSKVDEFNDLDIVEVKKVESGDDSYYLLIFQAKDEDLRSETPRTAIRLDTAENNDFELESRATGMHDYIGAKNTFINKLTTLTENDELKENLIKMLHLNARYDIYIEQDKKFIPARVQCNSAGNPYTSDNDIFSIDYVIPMKRINKTLYNLGFKNFMHFTSRFMKRLDYNDPKKYEKLRMQIPRIMSFARKDITQRWMITLINMYISDAKVVEGDATFNFPYNKRLEIIKNVTKLHGLDIDKIAKSPLRRRYFAYEMYSLLSNKQNDEKSLYLAISNSAEFEHITYKNNYKFQEFLKKTNQVYYTKEQKIKKYFSNAKYYIPKFSVLFNKSNNNKTNNVRERSNAVAYDDNTTQAMTFTKGTVAQIDKLSEKKLDISMFNRKTFFNRFVDYIYNFLDKTEDILNPHPLEFYIMSSHNFMTRCVYEHMGVYVNNHCDFAQHATESGNPCTNVDDYLVVTLRDKDGSVKLMRIRPDEVPNLHKNHNVLVDMNTKFAQNDPKNWSGYVLEYLQTYLIRDEKTLKELRKIYTDASKIDSYDKYKEILDQIKKQFKMSVRLKRTIFNRRFIA